jgi:hypothetical protein
MNYYLAEALSTVHVKALRGRCSCPGTKDRPNGFFCRKRLTSPLWTGLSSRNCSILRVQSISTMPQTSRFQI